MNVWVLTNTPSPYQVEYFAALEADGRCRPAVRFLRGEHRGTPWVPQTPPVFEARVLTGRGPSWWSDAFRVHPAAFREVHTGAHDFYVLSGQYTSLTFAGCARRLAVAGRPWAVWLEPPWPEDYRPAWSPNLVARNAGARWLRRTLLRRLVRRAPAVFGIGSAAVEAYAGLGVPRDRLSVVPYCCDTRRFEAVDPAAVRATREGLGLGGSTVFLYAGQFIPRKGIDVLLEAFGRIAGRHRRAALLLVGDGPLRGLLESGVPDHLRDRVRFTGHVAQSELPAYYGVADAFVLPSRHDGWGVVVNEACAAGLPVIGAASVGAVRDLVRDGENGFVVPRDDPAALAARMEELAGNPGRARAMGQRSRERVRAYDLAAGVDRFVGAVGQALGGHGAGRI